MKKIAILLIVAVLFSFVAPAFATLGPIRVELNLIKPRICAARANTKTAFKIYIRYNVDIKYNDWMKIWFPIDEYSLPADAADIPKSVCDGFGKIDENITDPRFVPNDAYFKKFTHSKLAGLGQVYESRDIKGSMLFYSLSEKNDWEDVCGNTKARIVKDPSGLGCWMLGTVLPPFPIDLNERFKALEKFTRSINIGYSGCMECYGFPIVINSCKERSIKFVSGSTFEAWRKGYNAIDFNTHKSTGIVAPATPGRYCVSVATEPEPEPVESEAFVLPCSDVSDVKIETTNLTDPDSFLSVKFRTGEGGALDQGNSTISLKFSKNLVFPKTISSKSIKVNGIIADWFAPSTINVDTSDKNFNIIKFQSYDDVENMSVCSVDFTS